MTIYQLSTYPQTSADYLRLYREACVSVKHSSQDDPRSRAYQRAVASITTEHVDFVVYLEVPGGVLAPDLLRTAEEVVTRIVELDAAARAVQTDPSYEEHRSRLAAVEQSGRELDVLSTLPHLNQS